MEATYQAIAKMLDHSLLKPTSLESELERCCEVALEYDVASVCIPPFFVGRCAELLAGSTVVPSTTIGFPHGGHATSVKCYEIERAIDDGCRELDMVVNVSKVLSGDWNYVEREIQDATRITHEAGQKIKIIFENCYLERQHKIRLCRICGHRNVDWVKTSTGFGTGGATLEDLQLMRQHAPEQVQVKASGGVRDLDALLRIRETGATRVGCSCSDRILQEWKMRVETND